MDQDKIKKLQQLSELYKEGILTKEEVEVEKSKILSGSISNTSSNENKQDLETFDSYSEFSDKSSKKIVNENPQSKTENVSTGSDPKRKNFIYIITALIILIGIGVFFGIYQHHQSVIAQQREQARLDSIAEVERLIEINRQDSIAEVRRILEIQRQDSIKLEEKLRLKPSLFIHDNFHDVKNEFGFILNKSGDDIKNFGKAKAIYTRNLHGRIIDYIVYEGSCETYFLRFHDQRDTDRFLKDLQKEGFEIDNSYNNQTSITYTLDKNNVYHSISFLKEYKVFQVGGC